MSILNLEPLLRSRFNSTTDDTTTHTYDYADRQVSMTTYGTETATTTWTYSAQRGFLTRKEYHDGEAFITGRTFYRKIVDDVFD